MANKRIKYLTLHVTVTADSYSNGKFTFSNGTKIITLKEISRSITEPLFGGSACEKPKAAGKPQMSENKNYSPDPLAWFCLEEPGMKAPGLSVGQRAGMLLPQELLS